MCSICERLQETKKGNDPFLIHEFENSYFELIKDNLSFKLTNFSLTKVSS